MSLPKTIAAYPPQMLAALDRAIETGELTIPCDKPLAMRLQFQGLRGAMRRAGKGEKADMVTFIAQTEPPALIIRLRSLSPLAEDITKALGATESPAPPDDDLSAPDAALARILGGLSPNLP